MADAPAGFVHLHHGYAVVFPGQGSQFVGMGLSLARESEIARRVWAEANDVLGYAASDLAWAGPASQLDETNFSQPGIFTASMAALMALRAQMVEHGEPFQPRVLAGHSLGEFTALVAAEAIGFPAALRIVQERGRLMKEAGDQHPGGMAAVLGLERDRLAQICADATSHGVIVLANDNCPGQSVISGEVAALEVAMEACKAAGAKRVTRLGISIASHSPLMEDASQKLQEMIGAAEIKDPRYPVVANASGALLDSADAVRAELLNHMVLPVNWTASVKTMIDEGAKSFIDVGPGQVLAGLIKRIDREVPTLGMTDFGFPAEEKVAAE